MRRRITFLVLLLLLNRAEAFSFTGEVVSVLDGDTIEVMHNGKAQRVRLYGIDCPEKGQPFGNNAKQAASTLVFAMEVTLEIHGKDKYGRILADVLLADGTNVNQRLVRDGWCWWYRKYAPEDAVLEALEAQARDTKIGLWADSEPVPPWEWRKSSKEKPR
jgi:micrococcal nuclease